MTARIFYTIAISFAVGIFVRSAYGVGSAFTGMLLVVGCGLAALWWKAGSARVPGALQSARTLIWSCAFVAVALGIVRFDMATRRAHDVRFDERVDTQVTLEGVIVQEVDERENSTHLTVRAETVDTVPVNRRVLVITERFPSFAYGDRVRVTGILERPEAFETDLGRTFDYSGYLSARGIGYRVSRPQVVKVGDGEGYAVLSLLLDAKHAFMAEVEAVLPEPHAGLAEGLVLGVKRALGADLEHAFRVAGVIHIVVLSGYNVTIVVEAIMRLLSFFFRPRTRALCGGAAIVAFALIAGPSATVVRASLMAALVLVARVAGRTYSVIRALVCTGLCMLIWNPYLLVFDPGFQLSFLATLGLIVVSPFIEVRLLRVPTRFQIREFVTATIAAQALVLPLLLYATGLLSVVALPVNVLILPLVPLTMLLIFLSATFGFMGQVVALPVAFSAYLLLDYMIRVVEYASMLSFAAFAVPVFPFWVVVVIYGGIGISLWRVSKRIQKMVPAPKEPAHLATSP